MGDGQPVGLPVAARVEGPVRILFVCRGNICRSPAAAALAVARSAGAVAATSAGTRAVVGRRVHPYTLTALAARGIDASRHVARDITAAYIADADLVLTMTLAQRSEVVRLH